MPRDAACAAQTRIAKKDSHQTQVSASTCVNRSRKQVVRRTRAVQGFAPRRILPGKPSPPPGRRFSLPTPHRCCRNRLSMKVYHRWSTSRRPFGHEEEGGPLNEGGMRALYQAFSDTHGRAFSGSYRSHPRNVPAAIAECRPTGNKLHPTSPSRSANAPTSPSARLKQAKCPAQERKSI